MTDDRLHRNQLSIFEKFLIADGWTICTNNMEHQALRAWKLNFKGIKKKWCIINEPVDKDSNFLISPNFSAGIVLQFKRGLKG